MDWKALDIVHPEAAGIDVGGSEHWVAVSPDRDPEPVLAADIPKDRFPPPFGHEYNKLAVPLGVG
jgi:hypothetical protein